MQPLRRAAARAALAALAAPWLVPAVAAVAGAAPAGASIPAAWAAVDTLLGDAGGWTAFAWAHVRRARETGDPAHYDAAEQAVGRALALAPDDLEARKARAWVLLGQHEFTAARALARALRERAPDDVLVHAVVADASVELGDYAAAERAVQTMLDLRPGSVPGLTRAAYLRELLGDEEGAIELLEASYTRLPAAEREERAWVLTQAAQLRLSEGRVEESQRLLEHALALLPGYHHALSGLARVRTAQTRHAEAVELLRRRYEAAPHPENLYELAQALERAGDTEAAGGAYLAFEEAARAESAGADNCNRLLVLYTVDRVGRPEEALRIARRERRRRADVFTRDAHAWALHASGQAERAQAEIEAALALGIHDPTLSYHAGVITLAEGDPATAADHFRRAAVPAAPPELAEAARRELAQLATGSEPRLRRPRLPRRRAPRECGVTSTRCSRESSSGVSAD